MAGIYIHIPFCKQACSYCNFYFSTATTYKHEMVLCIINELEIQKNYLDNEIIETIYFGGGTPSLLTALEIEIILHAIQKNFKLSESLEITLEGNPDDLSKVKIAELAQLGINRLSVGIQSFFEEDLAFMHRAHNAKEAFSCLENIAASSIKNTTLDLIYGFPLLTDAKWKQNIETAVSFGTKHISTYALTVEPKTKLHKLVKEKKLASPNQEKAAAQFLFLIDTLTKQDFEHYEISNFAKEKHYAKHNTSYWFGKKYLGVGPSAHSYNGISRQWNVSNNRNYIHAIKEKSSFFEIEYLTPEDKFNEYVLTRLRTQWGIDLKDIEPRFQKLLQEKMELILEKKWIVQKGNSYVLTNEGKLFADAITVDLME